MPDPGSPRGVEGPVKAGKLVAVAELNAQNVNFLLGDGPRDGAPHAIAPRLPERQRTFAGREAELAEVHARLGRAAEVGITQQTAVHGHGGIGKTSLAVEYAWRHLADYPGGVFSLACDTAADVPPLHELAPYLGIPAAETTDDTAAAVRARLERGEPALLILDNVRGAEQWQSRAWREALPGGACRRLITTRAPRLLDVHMYALQRLSTQDGVALLARYRPDALASRETVERVVEWFDGLAVGLTVVGIYLSLHPDLGWEPYFGSLEQKGLAAVRGTEQEVADVYEQRVDAVFDDLLAALSPAERRAVELAAVMPEDGIFAPWIVTLLSEEDGLDLPEPPGYEGRGAELVVRRLTSMQLLREQADGLLGLHRVLRRRVREVLEERGTLSSRSATLGAHGLVRAKACEEVVTRREMKREVVALVELAHELAYEVEPDVATEFANAMTASVWEIGDYHAGRTLFARFLTDEWRSQVPPLAQATLLTHLAMMQVQIGEFVSARASIESAVAIEEALLAPNDPSLAASFANLGSVLEKLGLFVEARGWIERAIDIEEAVLPPDHLELAASYAMIGGVLAELGMLDQAREYLERAIRIERTHRQSDHPKLAGRYSSLALILNELGDNAGALEYLRLATDIDQQYRDPQHPVLIIRYANMSAALNRSGDEPQAREYLQRAIEIATQRLEPDHPTLAALYNNWAHLEFSCKNLVEACRLFHKALEIGRKTFSDSHPDVQKYLEGVRRACGPDAIPPRADEAPN